MKKRKAGNLEPLEQEDQAKRPRGSGAGAEAEAPQDQAVAFGAGAGSDVAHPARNYLAMSLGGENPDPKKADEQEEKNISQKIIKIATESFCNWRKTEPDSQETVKFTEMLTACLNRVDDAQYYLLDDLEREGCKPIPEVFDFSCRDKDIELLEFLWSMANDHDKKAALLDNHDYYVLFSASENSLKRLVDFAREINKTDDLFVSEGCHAVFTEIYDEYNVSRAKALWNLANHNQKVAIFRQDNCELLHCFVRWNITLFMKEFFSLLTPEQNVHILLNNAKKLISYIDLTASQYDKLAPSLPSLFVDNIQDILTQFISKSLPLLTPEQTASFQANSASEILESAIAEGYAEIVRALITRFPVLLDDANIFGSVCRYGNVKVFEVIHAARPSLYLNSPASAFFTALRQGNFFLTEYILTLKPELINIRLQARQPHSNWLEYLLSSPALINDINSLIAQSRSDEYYERTKGLDGLVIIRRVILYLYAYNLRPANAQFHHSIQALFTKDGMQYDIRNTVEYAQTYLSLKLALAKDTGTTAIVAKNPLRDENLFSEIIPLLIPVPYLSFIEDIFADQGYLAIIQDVFCRIAFQDRSLAVMAIEPSKAVSQCQEAATYLGFRDISTIIAQDGVARYAKTLPAEADKKPLQATTKQVEKAAFACLIEAYKAKIIFADSKIPGKEMAAVIVQTMSKHSEDHKAGNRYNVYETIQQNLDAFLKAKQLAHMSLGNQDQAAGATGASSGSWTERVHVGARAFIFR